MKVKFWVKSSRMNNKIEKIVDIPNGLVDSDIKDRLEDWCRNQFDFDGTMAHVTYGWSEA